MKLEVGKMYNARNGDNVLIVHKFKNQRFLGVTKYDEAITSYSDDGFWNCRKVESPHDLISEHKEPEYIPFSESDDSEFITKEIIKRGGYLKLINRNGCIIPHIINNDYIIVEDIDYKMEQLFHKVTFADGTPFGKLKE